MYHSLVYIDFLPIALIFSLQTMVEGVVMHNRVCSYHYRTRELTPKNLRFWASADCYATALHALIHQVIAVKNVHIFLPVIIAIELFTSGRKSALIGMFKFRQSIFKYSRVQQSKYKVNI